MEQVPAATRVTVVPATVQTVGVVELNATVNPEVAVAETAKGAVPKATPLRAPKVIAWLGFTRKLRVIGVAASQAEFPGCVA